MTAPKRSSSETSKAGGSAKGPAAAKATGGAKPADVKPAKAAAPAAKQPARGPLMARLHKALRSQYKPVAANTNRPLLEQVLFACCLEDAPAESAEKAVAKVLEGAFDLNEIRVTTVAELAETLQDLPNPSRAALALRRALQGVFESTYNFSLEHARKHSLAHGIRTLENLHGISPFVVNYVASTALGGHLIPLDHGALAALYLAGIITQQEYDSGKVPGLERLVSKKGGAEFASLLHQFGVECLTNLHGATVRKILQAVNPAAKDRFPKRGESLPAPVPPPPATAKQGQKEAEAARQSAEIHRPAGPQAAARPAGKTPLPPPGSGPKRTADGKTPGGKTGPKPFVVKPNIGKPITIKPEPVVEKPVAKAPPAPPRKPAPPGKPVAKSPAPSSAKSLPPAKRPVSPPRKAVTKPAGSGKPHSQQLAKKKPR